MCSVPFAEQFLLTCTLGCMSGRGLLMFCDEVCRPDHPRIRRVQDWIEVEDALSELAALPPQR